MGEPGGDFRIWYKTRPIFEDLGERRRALRDLLRGNVAVHFSQDFAEKGYESGSHGCSQLRDYQVAKWLYEQVKGRSGRGVLNDQPTHSVEATPPG